MNKNFPRFDQVIVEPKEPAKLNTSRLLRTSNPLEFLKSRVKWTTRLNFCDRFQVKSTSSHKTNIDTWMEICNFSFRKSMSAVMSSSSNLCCCRIDSCFSTLACTIATQFSLQMEWSSGFSIILRKTAKIMRVTLSLTESLRISPKIGMILLLLLPTISNVLKVKQIPHYLFICSTKLGLNVMTHRQKAS